MIEIQTLTVGPFQSNCHIVACSETREALIVDAGDEGARILAKVAAMGVKVLAVLNTHAHLDHVAGLFDVVESLRVPVWMHADEIPIYDAVEQQAAMFGLVPPRRVDIDRYVEAGEQIRVGNLTGGILLTPGHSPGSVCLGFWGEEPPHLIAGDVLFMGSIGRTDLPGGDHDTLIQTLRDQFVPMPPDTVVYPGHGPNTTIGAEKQSNPFVAPLVREP